jgi:hypothetical protein
MAMLTAIFLENMTEYEFFRPNAMLWVLFVAITTYLGRAAMVARAARPPYRVPVAKPLARLGPRALTP